MKSISVFLDVLGPVMRGPSSSHTAGSHHLAALARSLLDERPVEAEIVFDRDGSYARCYRVQGSDLAFAAGLLGWPVADDRFPQALALAPVEGLDVRFRVERLARATHPNSASLGLRGADGRRLSLLGQSIGGGAVEILEIEGWKVSLRGDCHEIVAEVADDQAAAAQTLLEADGECLGEIERSRRDGRTALVARRGRVLPPEARRRLAALPGRSRVFPGAPLSFVQRGPRQFDGAAGLVRLAESQGLSAGEATLRYEAALLGLPEDEVLAEMARRVEVMVASVRRGLGDRLPSMQLLRPTAAAIYRAEAEGRLPGGGLHARAAARAMAAMHVNCGKGVVCAAPTAGSAGVLPATLVTLLDERRAAPRQLALAALAAGGIGVAIASRATFAAEVAGCQVEIGAAGAMAAAAVVEFARGSARQACDAAAIALQNTMGSVCDLVQGIVEIPCHTRNAVAAAAAFVNADLILGGYENPIPLDETIDAVYAVGLAMPPELRVTSRGGLALAPSAQALPRLDAQPEAPPS